MGERFRITDVPPGQAPKWVREQWVGLEMPVDEDAPKPGERFSIGVRGGRPENLGGFPVKVSDAMSALQDKAEKEESSKAARAVAWWQENLPLEVIPRLVFKRDVCVIIPEEKGK